MILIGCCIAAVSAGCSSENDEPSAGKETSASLIPAFRETYGFRAIDQPGKQLGIDSLIIPVQGVLTNQFYDYNDQAYPDWDNMITVREGVDYTPQHNPVWYAYWIKEYSDTGYNKPTPLSKDYLPHPYGITEIKMAVARSFSPGEPLSPYYQKFSTNDYNENYRMEMGRTTDCTSLFRIRYRSYYDFIGNGYSWKGLEQQGPWVEMDLTEFNERGGAQLMDMNMFYLIAKEEPFNKLRGYRLFQMDVQFANGKRNHNVEGLEIYSWF